MSVNAILSNQENTIVMVGTRLAQKYLAKFELLWKKGDLFPYYKVFPPRKVWRLGSVEIQAEEIQSLG